MAPDILAGDPPPSDSVCGTGDVYEALAEERGSLPEHGASRLEHFPLVREIASHGKVSWAWPGASPGPESRVTPLFLRPPLPTDPLSHDILAGAPPPPDSVPVYEVDHHDDLRRAGVQHQIDVLNTSSISAGPTPHELVYGRDHHSLIQSSVSSDDTSDPPPTDPEYSVRDRDLDYSRGMGHHLRWPVPPPSNGSKRRHSKTTSDNPVVVPPVVPSTVDGPVSRTPHGELPAAPHRTLRSRSKAPSLGSSSAPIKRSRVPVHQRWTYEPVVPVDRAVDERQLSTVAPSVVSLSAAVGSLPLVPRKP